jgi:hypothetical protein
MGKKLGYGSENGLKKSGSGSGINNPDYVSPWVKMPK